MMARFVTVMKRNNIQPLALGSLFLCAVLLSAQGSRAPAALLAAAENDSLVKATQNPVASLISVPLQNNSNFAVGHYDRTQDIYNIPVIPKRISEDWFLITRVIQPFVWQPTATQNTSGELGLCDMNPTFFLSPAHPGKLIYGVGPTMVFPTATSSVLGQGKLSFGPSVVALMQPRHWTFGFIANNAWSVVGSSHRTSVNQMMLQYFATYNLKKGWYLNTSPIIMANWHYRPTDSTTTGSSWTIPLGAGIGRVTRLGYQPVAIGVNLYDNVVHPPGASSWTMRLQLNLLFPHRPKG
jgi:hypothetical protein